MDSGRVLFERAQRINEQARQRVRKGIGAGGDVLLSHKGTVGKVAYVPMDAPPFVCSPQTTFWRVKDLEQLDRRYIYYYLLSQAFREQLDSRKGETDMADYVSLTTQRTLKIIVPPLAEQRSISGLLGALDDKIELNRRMNATLEAMARTLFQSWFVDFDPVRVRLDGRPPSGPDIATATLFPNSFEDSEGRHIPKGWTVGKVNDVAALNRDAINPGDYPTETFDHFSLPAFDNGRTPKTELGSSIKSNKFTLTPDAVLLSKLNPHIPRIWLPDLHPSRRSVCSTEFIVARSKPGVTREYLFSLFASSTFASIYETLVTGTTGSHQRIRPETVLDMKIVIPAVSLIQAFTEIVRPMFDRINRNTEQSRTLAGLRDTLLPKLLSGELRLGEMANANWKNAQ
jgi:type I restriction enzyme S subunit